MSNKTEFKPYIPAERVTPEITITSIIMGIILSIVFGAANAYLGLRVGMTVSASIPAAVISMGVIRVLMRKNSILESNLVQTIGSAGESLAAGAIFTLPALFLWAAEGKMDKPGIVSITLIALLGGLLGVFFMVPLRNALIVKEHGILPYPEGTACAEVLLAGEKGGANASTVFAGMGFAALFKFIIDGLRLVAGEISFRVKGFAGEIGTQIYPAVMSVGYICGARISSYMFAGGVLSWLVIIPLIVLFGENIVLYPGTDTIGNIFAAGGASAIWSSYIRYIGAGALAAGGIISLIKSLPLIITTFGGAMKSMASSKVDSTERTAKDINIKVVLLCLAVLTLLVWLVPAIPVSFLGAVIVVVFGFFFATVSSRMVGLVGSSNNPVSGMAIATLLVTTLILKATGTIGIAGMTSAIAIGSIICNTAFIAGLCILIKPLNVEKKPLILPTAFFFATSIFYVAISYTTGEFSRWIGIIFLLIFAAYIAINVLKVRTQAFEKASDTAVKEKTEKLPLGKEILAEIKGERTSVIREIIMLVLGIVAITFGADFLVNSTIDVANVLGIPQTVISLTVVALGTSLPELITAIAALIKGHSSLSIGNIIGANLFNLVLVNSVAVIINPYSVPTSSTIGNLNTALVLDIPLMLAVMAILALPAIFKGKLSRLQGASLVVLYIAFCLVQFFFSTPAM